MGISDKILKLKKKLAPQKMSYLVISLDYFGSKNQFSKLFNADRAF